MKKVLNFFKGLIIVVWIVIAIFVTVCLLSYNEFKVVEFGKTTLLIIDNDELKPEFKNQDLVIVNRDIDSKIKVGDRVFFYNGNQANEYLINMGEVTGKENVTSSETTFEIEGEAVSGQYVIGNADKVAKMPVVGLILGIFLSRWGFMFLVILPTLFAIVYEVIRIVSEVRRTKKETKETKETDE